MLTFLRDHHMMNIVSFTEDNWQKKKAGWGVAGRDIWIFFKKDEL